MIHVIDDYYINADKYQYTAILDTHAIDKDNKIVYSTIGYYQTVKDAVIGISKHLQKKLANTNAVMELNEYLKSCEMLNNQLKEIVDKIEDTIMF